MLKTYLFKLGKIATKLTFILRKISKNHLVLNEREISTYRNPLTNKVNLS